MRKVTKTFLNTLSLFSENAKFINVKPIEFDSAKPNECFQNCMKFLDESRNFGLRSGWLIGEYWGASGTAIIPHYWVYETATGSNYDVTPILGAQTFEYILDMNILYNINDQLKISVPVPLKMMDDGSLLARIGLNNFVVLDEFSYDEIFQLADITKQ